MKKHLACLALFLTLALCLVGCAGNTAPTDPPEESTNGESDRDALEEAETRIAYYEALVVTMQEQMLQLRAALYESRVEYDALYEDYLATQAPQEPDALFTYVKDGDGVTVTGYLGAGGEVTVPATLGGLPVCAIGDRAFADRNDVTAVVLPVGILRVGWFAFSGCVSLARISLPGSITAISYGAFENCPQTLTVLCPAGSYAEQYAISYGLRVVN